MYRALMIGAVSAVAVMLPTASFAQQAPSATVAEAKTVLQSAATAVAAVASRAESLDAVDKGGSYLAGSTGGDLPAVRTKQAFGARILGHETGSAFGQLDGTKEGQQDVAARHHASQPTDLGDRKAPESSGGTLSN